MAGLRVDQAFVERLQDIDLNVVQAEAGHLPRSPHHEVGTLFCGQHPVEEVRLTLAGNPKIGECRAVEQGGRVLRRNLDHRIPGHRLRDDDKIGVLEEQAVIADIGAVSEAEKPVPECALQPRLGSLSDLFPHRIEGVEGSSSGEALTPEFPCDGVRIRQQAVACGDDTLQPNQQLTGRFRVRMVDVDLLDAVIPEEEGDEIRAIGGDADILFASLPFAIR